MAFSISWRQFKSQHRLAIGLLGLLALLLCGCQSRQQMQPKPHFSQDVSPLPPAQAKQADTLGIYDLAHALSLNVVDSNPSFFSLKNDHDSVMIFTYDGAYFYVNGKPCGKVGPVETMDPGMRFNRSLVDRIRSHLNQAPTSGQRSIYHASGNRGTIVIDPGHGGHDPGTTSVLGYKEKTLVLKVGLLLAGILKDQGFHVVMTRDRDVYLTLEERAAIANRVDADLFISVHADSNPSPAYTGYTVFVSREASRESRLAANMIMHAMESTGIDSRGVRQADYRVLVKTRCPAVLVELGHISNYTEARRLLDASMQQRLAQAIARGTERLWAK